MQTINNHLARLRKTIHTDQRGAEAVEWIALIAVLLILLLAFSPIARAGGSQSGQSIVDKVSCWTGKWSSGGSCGGGSSTVASNGGGASSGGASSGGTTSGNPLVLVANAGSGAGSATNTLATNEETRGEDNDPAPPNGGIQIDWDFIVQQEGNSTTGYVPLDGNGDVFGNSGVTIGAGFDLGQHDRAYMIQIGIPTRIVDILDPYTGHQREAAVNYLNSNPLQLTANDTRIVNERVKLDKAQQIIRAYDAASDVDFESLPVGAQTVITSVAFQYGYLPTRTPRFWGLATQQDWDGMVAELRNFGDAYGPRRNREADFLENNQ